MRLHQEDRPAEIVGVVDAASASPTDQAREVLGIRVSVAATAGSACTAVVVTAESVDGVPHRLYVSVGVDRPGAVQYGFNGRVAAPEVFRQSPHDASNHVFDMPMQAVPLVAVSVGGSYDVGVSDAPAFSDNATTQVFDPVAGSAAVCSGDSGECPGRPPRNVQVGARYHAIRPGQPHVFRCIVLRCSCSSIESLRDAVLGRIAAHWAGGATGRLGRVSVASNYMHYRRNETGNSVFWIVPGIEYANKQYSRDAFWQSLVLPGDMARQCFANEVRARSRGAERPLFGLIWAGRLARGGQTVDPTDAAWFLDYVEAHTKDGRYHSYDGNDRYDFQSWYDLCAFSAEDVITYNQGLLAAALIAARECGLTPRTPAELAARRYRELYDTRRGYFPLSAEKDLICMDALVGDLLARVLFGVPLLPEGAVAEHYRTAMLRARTEHGFKVVCRPDGSYPAVRDYAHAGYLNSHLVDMEPGSYAHGGSYFLYDMLFLMDAYLCGVADAEERMIWRALLELDRGGTTYEHIHTVTGVPHKANQGWNGAVYALWGMLAGRGQAGSRFLPALGA